jgi:hypothetical protein
VVEVEGPVEPCLDVVADRHDANRMPLTERRRLDPGARELTAPAIVVVEAEVVLQGIRADNVVLPSVKRKTRPPEASSRPEIGLNFIETSRSVYGPGGATITLNSFLVARWTSTRFPLAASGLSSTVH